VLPLLMVAAIAGCGKKGPPVAPETREPRAPDSLSATVGPDGIAVAWTNPRTRADNSRLRDLTTVRLYRSADDGRAEPKPAIRSGDRVSGYDLLGTIDLARPLPATLDGRQVRLVDRKDLIDGRRYTYVVLATDSRGRTSPPSPRRSVVYIVAPEPPGPLSGEGGEREARLAWEPPRRLQDGRPLTGALTYEVLRAVSPDAPPVPVTAAPIADPRYTDAGLENEQTYHYAVRAIRADAGGIAQSDLSPPIAVTPRDMTPPSPPTGLVVLPSAGTARLAWQASPEPDVAGYVIYREGATGGVVRVGSVPAPATVFVDRNVPSGPYRYSVSTIDRASQPNESAPSQPTSAIVP
jgi:hypothetical protein